MGAFGPYSAEAAPRPENGRQTDMRQGLPRVRGRRVRTWLPYLRQAAIPVNSVHRTSKCSGMADKQIFKVIFMAQGQIYEVYARNVSHGDLFGFIEVEQLVFGERSSVVVDPSEEKIKSEFENVRRTWLPMHSIVRIDEVDKQGQSKISKMEGSNVAQFPMPIYTPTDS